jgi:hypothetical protein
LKSITVVSPLYFARCTSRKIVSYPCTSPDAFPSLGRLDMRAAGQSLGAIAKHLNVDGYVTRTGASWSAVQVMRVLNRAA